jgi:predicted dehydrogenase
MNRLFSSDVEDEVYSNLFFAGGLSGQISANWSDESQRKMSTKVSVWGTNGKIVADRQEMKVYLRDRIPDGFNKGWNSRYTTDLTEPVWFYLRGEEYSAQVSHFVEAIKSGHTETRSDFRSAVDTDLVLSAMVKDADRRIGAAAMTSVMPDIQPAPSSLAGLLRRHGPRNLQASA